MVLKYDLNIDNKIIAYNLNKNLNAIFKLLPLREEGGEWIKPTETIIIELTGMNSLLCGYKDFFPLICKLEGLKELGDQCEFQLFRRCIFECCSLVGKIKESVENEL